MGDVKNWPPTTQLKSIEIGRSVSKSSFARSCMKNRETQRKTEKRNTEKHSNSACARRRWTPDRQGRLQMFITPVLMPVIGCINETKPKVEKIESWKTWFWGWNFGRKMREFRIFFARISKILSSCARNTICLQRESKKSMFSERAKIVIFWWFSFKKNNWKSSEIVLGRMSS